MRMRVLAAIPCLIIAWSTAVNADVLVLRDGSKLDGILSNSALVRREPAAFAQITFLVGDGPDAVLRRFDTSAVAWILVEAPEGPAVIDFEQLQWQGQAPEAVPPRVSVPGPSHHLRIHLDVVGGPTWSRFDGDHSAIGQDFRQGLSAGVRLTILQRGFAGASLGAFYVQKGAVRETSPLYGRVARLEYRMDYLEVPVCLVGRIPIGKGALRLHAGPALGILVSAKRNGTGWINYGQSELDGEQDIFEDTVSLDLDLTAGMGIELPLSTRTSLLVEGGYGHSITTFEENAGLVDWTHEVLSLEVGLSFMLTGDDDTPNRDRDDSFPRWRSP
jgi:hypothetical protein